MYYNKNSFISASHGVYLRPWHIKYPLNWDLRSCGYVKNLSELRKEEARKEKSSISSFIVKGLPTSARCLGFMGPPPVPCG